MDHDKILNLGAELGRQLMASGAEIHRVEESVQRLLTAYGMDPQVFAIPNCLIVSVNTPEGQPVTRMCRIPAHGTDIELLERCNALCRQLCQDPLPVDEARRMVGELKSLGRSFSPPSLLLGYAAAAAFFSLFFGGNWKDFLSAALCGLAVGLCQLFGSRFTGSNLFFRTAVLSGVASALAALLVLVGFGHSLESITIGTLMLLVPGMALTNAMREFMAGDVLSGLARTVEVILVGTAIALGAAIPLLLFPGLQGGTIWN